MANPGARMASYLEKMKQDIMEFIECADKTVLIVGAGGGKLFGYADSARKVYALDRNDKALDKLKETIPLHEQGNKYELICDYFENVNIKVDIAMFEYSLHEIADPYNALKHVKNLAERVIVAEHSSDSEWIRLAQEDQNVKKAEEGLKRFAIKRANEYLTGKEITDIDDLTAKLGYKGNDNVPGIFAEYKNKNNYVVGMKYRIYEI
jgi:ubiquinone/menaquinone biosynthesis C-methylase UbiE